MPGPQAGSFYERPTVVSRYVADRADGLSAREERAIDRYFAPESSVLDLGCGAGRTTHVLAQKGYDVVGLDASESMVRAAADADPGIDYVTGDAAQLPVADSSVENALFSYNGIDDLEPPAARVSALEEVFRVLAPGGRFAFSMRNVLRKFVPYPPTPEHLGDLLRFWVDNALRGNVGSPYKYPTGEAEAHRLYFTNPLSAVRQVSAVGFDVVDLLGRSGRVSRYLGGAIFLVVEKPPSSAASDS